MTADIKQETKSNIQDHLWEQMGSWQILVDVIKQGRKYTNCGNTSKRFLEKSSVTVKVTKIEEILVKRIATILEANQQSIKGSNNFIDANKFHEYTHQTALTVIDLY